MKNNKIKKCLMLLLLVLSTVISAFSQSTGIKEPSTGKGEIIYSRKESSNFDNMDFEKLERSQISEALARIKKLENENLQLKQQLNDLENKYLTHTHKIGGFIGTGFQLTDKLSPGSWIAIPFSISGEEMKRNNKTGYPSNE